MHLKNWIVCSLLFFGVIPSGFSQDTALATRIRNGVDRMTKELSLSADQASELMVLDMEFEVNMGVINNTKMKDSVKGAEKDQVFKKRESDLKRVFTAGQYAAYRKALDENRLPLPPAKGVDPGPGGFISDEEY